MAKRFAISFGCAALLTSCQVNPLPESAPKPVEKVQARRAITANKSTSETVLVNLAWDANPEPDIAGYQIHFGTAPNAYDQVKDVGNVTSATVGNLPVDRNYFALTAYNEDGFESALSAEIGVGEEATPTPTPSVTATPSASPSPSATAAPSPTSTPGRLINISTRAFVQTGNNILIAGFVIRDHPRRVIARAIGPSLPGSFPAVLANPFLELRNSFGSLIDENDNWRDDQEAEIVATGIPPANDQESAIVRILEPGSYTAIVHGVNGGTGVALVEVYAIE